MSWIQSFRIIFNLSLAHKIHFSKAIFFSFRFVKILICFYFEYFFQFVEIYGFYGAKIQTNVTKYIVRE